MHEAYFVSTPFQLFTSILIKMERKNMSADMYIMNRFSMAEEYGRRIQKENVFCNVKIVEVDQIFKKYGIIFGEGLYAKLSIAKSYFSSFDIAREILISDCEYDAIFVSSTFLLYRFVEMYLQKINSNVKFICIEDGLGSYLTVNNKWIVSDPSKMDIFFRSIILQRKPIKYSFRYLFSPRLFHMIQKSIPNETIIKIDFKMNNFFRNLFNMADGDKLHRKFILLDIIKEVDLDSENCDRLNEIYEWMKKQLGDELEIRPHPRDKMQTTQSATIPFELLCANTEDIDDKVLISYMSTALFSPFILLEKKPFIILLNKMVCGKYEYSEIDDLVRFMNKMGYNGKIFSPKNINDLSIYLTNIKMKQ